MLSARLHIPFHAAEVYEADAATGVQPEVVRLGVDEDEALRVEGLEGGEGGEGAVYYGARAGAAMEEIIGHLFHDAVPEMLPFVLALAIRPVHKPWEVCSEEQGALSGENQTEGVFLVLEAIEGFMSKEATRSHEANESLIELRGEELKRRVLAALPCPC